jgi:hypothetical protein
MSSILNYQKQKRNRNHFNNFPTNLGGMSYNVPGIRRFDRPNKQTAGLQGGQNVAEQNTTKGVQGLQPTPDWCFV